MTVSVKIFKNGVLVEEKDIETKVANEESTIQPKRKSRKAAEQTPDSEQAES